MAEIDPPRERTCERCGRVERFDSDRETWIGESDSPGNQHCVHVWNITGSYNPVRSQ